MPEHLLFVILPNVFRVAKGVHIRADDDQGSVVLGFDLGSTEIRVDHGWILVESRFRFSLSSPDKTSAPHIRSLLYVMLRSIYGEDYN